MEEWIHGDLCQFAGFCRFCVLLCSCLQAFQADRLTTLSVRIYLRKLANTTIQPIAAIRMSRHTNPLEPAEVILNGLLSRQRQSPEHPTNFLKAAKLCRLGEIAVMLQSERMMALAMKLMAATGLDTNWDPYPTLSRSIPLWSLPAPELWEALRTYGQDGATPGEPG